MECDGFCSRDTSCSSKRAKRVSPYRHHIDTIGHHIRTEDTIGHHIDTIVCRHIDTMQANMQTQMTLGPGQGIHSWVIECNRRQGE